MTHTRESLLARLVELGKSNAPAYVASLLHDLLLHDETLVDCWVWKSSVLALTDARAIHFTLGDKEGKRLDHCDSVLLTMVSGVTYAFGHGLQVRVGNATPIDFGADFRQFGSIASIYRSLIGATRTAHRERVRLSVPEC